MFPIRAKQVLPIDAVYLQSVSVRGELGQLTVWVSREARNHSNIRIDENHWECIYEGNHTPPPTVGRRRTNRHTYTELTFTRPVRLVPGHIKLLYVHSKLPGDEAIVYDNSELTRHAPRYEDAFVSIHSGKAHLSPEPFGQTPIWGWGNAFRYVCRFSFLLIFWYQ